MRANKLKFAMNFAKQGAEMAHPERFGKNIPKNNYFEPYINQVKNRAKPNIPITNKGYYVPQNVNGNKAFKNMDM